MSRYISKQPSFTTSEVERNVLMTLPLVCRYRQIAISAFDTRQSAASLCRRRESTFKSIYDNRVGVSLTMWEVNCETTDGRRKFVILVKSHTLSRWNDLLACIKSQNFSFFFLRLCLSHAHLLRSSLRSPSPHTRRLFHVLGINHGGGMEH